MKKRDDTERERIEKAILAAAEGRNYQIHNVIQRAGYIMPGAMTQAQIAAQWRNDKGTPLTVESVRQWVKRDGLAYSDAARKMFALADVIAWRERRLSGVSDDPDLCGDDSPSLERYRAAKAALAEYDLEQKKGSLVALQFAAELVMRAASQLKRAGEVLGRRFGEEARGVLNDALGECEREAAAWVSSEPFEYAEKPPKTAQDRETNKDADKKPRKKRRAK